MTTKIAVSLPDDHVSAAKDAVAAGRSASVSAYITEALDQRRREDGLRALLDEMDAEVGAPAAEDRTWARQTLGLE